MRFDDASALLTACQSDNVFFIEKVLNSPLWEKQREIARSVVTNRRTAVKSCHASGKTYLAARIALWFLYCFPYARVVTTAPTHRQVVNLLWGELRRAYNRTALPLGGNLLQTALKIEDGWDAIGFTSDLPDNFQGIHSESGYVLVLVDEASGVPRQIIEAIEGILTGINSRLLTIGNPTDPSGWWANEFRAPGTERFTISAFDTPNLRKGRIVIPGLIDADWVADKKTRWGAHSPAYRARVLGEFPDSASNQIFQLNWLHRAMERDDLRPHAFDQKVLGVDVARFGDDKTVVYMRHGPVCTKLAEWQYCSTMTSVAKVMRLWRDHGASMIRVDDVGVGGGVSDRLIELGAPCVRVNVGRSARDPTRFINLRGELLSSLADALQHGHIQLDKNDDLLHQAASIQYDVRDAGKWIPESKKLLKERIRVSPDDLDALMLAFADGLHDEIVPAISGLERSDQFSALSQRGQSSESTFVSAV